MNPKFDRRLYVFKSIANIIVTIRRHRFRKRNFSTFTRFFFRTAVFIRVSSLSHFCLYLLAFTSFSTADKLDIKITDFLRTGVLADTSGTFLSLSNAIFLIFINKSLWWFSSVTSTLGISWYPRLTFDSAGTPHYIAVICISFTLR